MRCTKWLLVLSFVVISSLLAACGGGGGEKPGTATAPAAASPAGNTPEAGTTPEAATTPAAQQGGGQFGDLAAKFANVTFKATYSISGGSGATGTQDSMTMYKKGDNLRIDMTGEIQGQQQTAIFITRPDQSYLCSDMPEMGGGTCFTAPSDSGQGAGDMIAGLESALTDPSVEVVSTSSRQIAGEDATCYTVRAPDSEGDSEVCLNSDAVPLFTRDTTGGQEMSVEATSFGHDVSDSDFDPPYPVSADISSIPSGQ
jgi:hypothetical protein